MEPRILAGRLREVAESRGIEVRTGPADSEGAVVRLRGSRVVFVPEGAPADATARLIARALAPLDLEGVFLLPAVREAVDRAREEQSRRAPRSGG
jgi:hypothetical protein